MAVNVGKSDDTGKEDKYQRRWQALIVLSLVQFVLVIDDSVVNIAAPSVQRALGFSQASLAWVNSSYVLVFGGLLLLGGRLGDLLGRRRLFLIGVALFAVSSLACGLAAAPWQLIAARAVQGLGAALAAPTALALLVVAFTDGKERTKALAMWGISAGAGGLLGVILGGVLTDLASWRAVFLVNVPIAALVLVLLPRLAAESKDPAAGKADIPGGITITVAMSVLIYGLLELGNTGQVTRLVPALAVAAVLFAVFAIIQYRSANPLIPRGFLAERVRLSGVVSMLLMAGATMAQFFVLSLYLQQVLGFSPMATGFALAPQAVISFVFFPVSAVIINKLGLRVALPLGLVIMAVGFALFGRISADGSYLADVLPSLAILAVGGPLAFTSVTTAVVGEAGEEAGLASGVVDAAQQLGTGIGLALFVTLATRFTVDGARHGGNALAAQARGMATAFQAGAAVLVAIAVIAFLLMGQTSLKASMGPPGE